VMCPRLHQVLHRNPVGRGNLRVESWQGTGGEKEHERSHRDRREYRGPGHNIGEPPDKMLGRKRDPYLFGHLTHGRGREVRIAWFLTAAGKSHVAGPRVAGSFGSADEEDRIGIGREDNRDRGPKQSRIVLNGVLAGGQTLAQLSEPAGQCE
jgi:hypothetical protein